MALLSLSDSEQQQLLQTAWASLRSGLVYGRPCQPTLAGASENLVQPAATFVTLYQHGQLRGCIGRLEAVRPLLIDVAENAFQAAFHDPRFAPVSKTEVDELKLEISILTTPEAITATSEADLIGQLTPDQDGLILRWQQHQATFLPSVWQSLPEPSAFLRNLKLKAGLAGDFWQPDIEFQRYRVILLKN